MAHLHPSLLQLPSMIRHGAQEKLFDTPSHLPNGLIYRADFLTPEEEEEIIYAIEALPLTHATQGEYTAKRRVKGFGWSYDFERKKFIPGPPLPHFLKKFQRKIAKWLDIPPSRVAEALVTEYPPGTAIGWHRDREEFEHIVGLSLSGWCRMRFRPLSKIGDAKAVVSAELEPRSAYIMQKDVRWKWQHSVAATRTLRYSITFRTLPTGTLSTSRGRIRIS